MDKDITKIERLLSLFPLYSEDLAINISEPSGRFKWFVAAILFGARIGEQTAANTYRCFEAAQIVDSPNKIIEAGWDKLVEVLDAGGYVRYDFSTASKLLEVMSHLKRNYGSLENLYRRALSEADLEERLKEFKGIGPTTTQIFLRELRGVWQIQPKVAKIARSAARNLKVSLSQFDREKLARVESALVKLHLRFCKRGKCRQCPMADFCTRM